MLRPLLLLILIAPAALAGNFTNGTNVQIPLRPTQSLPANDLVYTDQDGTRILSPEDAWELEKNNHVDLSRLEPDGNTRLWKSTPSFVTARAADEALPVQSGDTVTFNGAIITPKVRARFNATTLSTPSHGLSIYMSRSLHTLLLRRELLRRLGYDIPAMKYLPRLKVRFPNAKDRDFFLNTHVPDYAGGNSDLWVIPPAPGSDPLTVELQDVLAVDGGASTNLAFQPPLSILNGQIQPEKQRILRALSIPYGLANLPESVNQFDWSFGKSSGGVVSFDVSDVANFSCGYDDAVWMLRKIASFTRADFEDMVSRANYPDSISQLIVEKLISRRNTILDSFGMNPGTMAFDPSYTELPEVSSGKVIQKEWPGYASKFAFSDTESPLHGIQWYLLSQVESNVLEALMRKANSEIPGFTQAGDQIKHQEILAATQQWMQNGQGQSVPLKTWIGPILNGQLNLSRSVVIGNYLGTNNPISLADTLGITINAGLIIGVDGLPTTLQAGGNIQGSLTVNYTHIKPIKRMKQTVTEPIKNALVPWIARRTSRALKDIGDLQNATGVDPIALKDEINQDLDELDRFLGVGESLLITESITGVESASVGARLPSPVTPQAGIQAGANQLLISRIQFYRKDPTTIQIFKDNGHLSGLSLTMEVSIGGAVQFPIATLNGKTVRGAGTVKVFNVNLDSDVKANPNFYSNAVGVSAAIRSGTTSVLESRLHPAVIHASFRDKSGYLRILHHVKRKLKSRENIEIELPDGTDDHFITFNDGKQKGAHYQALATDAANYLYQVLTQQGNPQIDTQASENPGQSVFGHAQTRNAQFQGRIDHTLTDPFVQIQYRWQGWNKSATATQELFDLLSRKYGFKLYPDGILLNLHSLQLYQINLSVDLYGPALRALTSMSESDEEAIEDKYRKIHHCFLALSFPCASIHRFHEAMIEAREHSTDPAKQAEVDFKVASNLEAFTDFSDLVKLVGGADNLYVNSNISGFRTKTELTSDQILSNTYGKPDPYFPDGVLSAAQTILDISNGEMYLQWLREVL